MSDRKSGNEPEWHMLVQGHMTTAYHHVLNQLKFPLAEYLAKLNSRCHLSEPIALIYNGH